MILEKERIQIVEYGKKLITNRLNTGTGGNISIFNREEGLVAISPSGIDYFDTKPEDVVVMDIEGNIIESTRKPSSEYPMHKIFYERRDDINSIIHTHADATTTLACLGWELPPIHYLIGYTGGNVRCTDYVTFGTSELAETAFEGMKDRNAVLLGNHGIIAGGVDIKYTFTTIEQVEFISRIYLNAKSVGEPKLLGDKELEIVLQQFKKYAQKNE